MPRDRADKRKWRALSDDDGAFWPSARARAFEPHHRPRARHRRVFHRRHLFEKSSPSSRHLPSSPSPSPSPSARPRDRATSRPRRARARPPFDPPLPRVASLSRVAVWLQTPTRRSTDVQHAREPLRERTEVEIRSRGFVRGRRLVRRVDARAREVSGAFVGGRRLIDDVIRSRDERGARERSRMDAPMDAGRRF